MSIKIALFTQWFDPEPTFKGLAFAKELVRRGFDVEVVTGFPNYPGGRLYDGYKLRVVQREVIGGVRVTRLPLYPSHDGSALKRIANYVSFAASGLLYGLFMLRRPDVIYAYHPPLTVGVSVSILRLIRRIPVVYDVQDMWPDTLRATGMVSSERVLSIVSHVCDWVYKRVDRIVVLSPGFKRLLLERGVPERKLDVIYNWCDESSLAIRAQPKLPAAPSRSEFRVVFAGNMGKAQALYSVVEAAELLASKLPVARFVFVGSGVEVDCLKGMVLDKGLVNVSFIPRMPMNEMGDILSMAHALLVHLKDDPLFEITIPSKTQAYMAMGRPLLMAVRGDAAALVKEAGCGVIAIPEDPQSLAEAVIKLANLSSEDREEMGVRASSYYNSELSMKKGVERFSTHFIELSMGKNASRSCT